VIGGTSAGAAIMTRVMIQSGRTEANEGQGFDLLADAVVDQHFLKRKRMDRLVKLLEKHPGLLGFGIDESTFRGWMKEALKSVDTTMLHAQPTPRPVPKTRFPELQADLRERILRGEALESPELAERYGLSRSRLHTAAVIARSVVEDPDSSTVDRASMYCRVESSIELISSIETDLKRILNSNIYSLGPIDRRRLRNILNEAASALNEKESENATASQS